jgi:hypothetical protein
MRYLQLHHDTTQGTTQGNDEHDDHTRVQLAWRGVAWPYVRVVQRAEPAPASTAECLL